MCAAAFSSCPPRCRPSSPGGVPAPENDTGSPRSGNGAEALSGGWVGSAIGPPLILLFYGEEARAMSQLDDRDRKLRQIDRAAGHRELHEIEPVWRSNRKPRHVGDECEWDGRKRVADKLPFDERPCWGAS